MDVEARQRAAAGMAMRRRRSVLSGFLRFIRTKPLGTLGLFLVLLAGFTAVSAPVLAPNDATATFSDHRLEAPSTQFWFGTDNLARDVLSRVIYAARVSILVGFVVMIVSTVIGSTLGILSAYLGGLFDLLVQRLVDIMISLPSLILALAFVAVLSSSLRSVIIALIVASGWGFARTIRSVALGIKSYQYVEAARAIGAGGFRIMLFHITPNCFAPILVIGTATIGQVIVAEATLSFLGLGVPPSVPTWGNMLSGGISRYAVSAPWIAVFPGLALTLTALGINLLGDAVRDVADPRLRGAR